MWKNIAFNILRYKQYFIVGLAIWFLLLIAILLSSDLQFSRSNAQLLPDDDVAVVHLKEFSQNFGSEENVFFIGVYDKDLQDPTLFDSWLKLLQNIKSLTGVKEIISVGNAQNIVKDTLSQSFHAQAIESEIQNRADFDKALEDLNALPFYQNLLYNQENTALQNLVYLDSELVNTQAREQIVWEIEKQVRAFSKAHNIPIYTSGMPLIRTMNAQEVKSESYIFILLALFVTCFIFTLIFRLWKATFTVLLIVILAVVSSFATMAILGYEITILTALVPPLMIVIGVPNCIFLLNKYFQEYQLHQNKAKALTRTIMKIGNATFLTNFTTAFGFLTFVFTNSQTLREFGVVASLNIMLIFIYSLLIIPIAFSYFKPPSLSNRKVTSSAFMERFNNRLVYWVTEKRKWVFGISLALFLMSVFGISLMSRSANMLDDMSKNTRFYKDISFFDDNFGGILPVEIIVKGQPQSALQMGTLKRVDRLYKDMSAWPSIGKPLSLMDGVKFARQAYYNGNPKYYELPSTYEKTFIMNYIKNSKGERSMLNRYVDDKNEILRISTVMKNEDSDKLEQSFDSITYALNQHFGEGSQESYITGVAYVFMKGTQYLTTNLLVSLALAIFMISVMMALMFRSVKMIIISIIPNLLPLIITAGFMGYFGIPIKPSTILVFSIAFGIAVDDTIHYLAKYRQEMHRYPDIQTGVLKALRETSNAMFYSSVVLFSGFSMFLFSGFQGIQALGGLVSITLLFAVFSNLILLPSLLLQFKGSTDKDFVFPDIDYFEEKEEE